jgi:hypothetical protein
VVDDALLIMSPALGASPGYLEKWVKRQDNFDPEVLSSRLSQHSMDRVDLDDDVADLDAADWADLGEPKTSA